MAIPKWGTEGIVRGLNSGHSWRAYEYMGDEIIKPKPLTKAEQVEYILGCMRVMQTQIKIAEEEIQDAHETITECKKSLEDYQTELEILTHEEDFPLIPVDGSKIVL